MVRLVGIAIAALTFGASCSTNMSSQKCRIISLPIDQKASTMIDIVDQLSNAHAKSLQISDVENLFGVTLTRSDQYPMGDKFTNDLELDGFKLEVFIVENREFRLAIEKVSDQTISEWRNLLAERGWIAESPIRHPFIMDSFQKNGRQIRLMHNNYSVFSITVFGLNTPGGK